MIAKPVAGAVLAVVLAGCAHSPELASRPKAVQYAHMNCGQLMAEDNRLEVRLASSASGERGDLESQQTALRRAYSFQQCYLFASL